MPSFFLVLSAGSLWLVLPASPVGFVVSLACGFTSLTRHSSAGQACDQRSSNLCGTLARFLVCLRCLFVFDLIARTSYLGGEELCCAPSAGIIIARNNADMACHRRVLQCQSCRYYSQRPGLVEASRHVCWKHGLSVSETRLVCIGNTTCHRSRRLSLHHEHGLPSKPPAIFASQTRLAKETAGYLCILASRLQFRSVIDVGSCSGHRQIHHVCLCCPHPAAGISPPPSSRDTSWRAKLLHRGSVLI